MFAEIRLWSTFGVGKLGGSCSIGIESLFFVTLTGRFGGDSGRIFGLSYSVDFWISVALIGSAIEPFSVTVLSLVACFDF